MTQGLDLTASQALAAMRAGRLTAVAYASACLERVRLREPLIAAWQFVDADLVLSQARAADECAASGTAGPLNGLPIGIKDVCQTADMPTQHHSPIYRQAAASHDAAVVALLRHAGAVIFGKTHTVEFAATGAIPPTRNPHDPRRTPGGSSSGSAAAVADMHVPLAIGTQTGGSLIRPASFCGIHGFKPSWGTVSSEGCKRFAPSLDTVGWYGRSVDDLQLLLGVLDPQGDAVVAPNRPLRIAVCRTHRWDRTEPSTRRAIDAAASLLSQDGATIAELTLPPEFEALFDLHAFTMRAEGGISFLADTRRHGQHVHARIREQVAFAQALSRAELARAYDLAAHCRSVFDALVSGFDAVLTPSTVGEAPPLSNDGTGSMLFNGLWTLLHVPCVNVPGLSDPAGLPVGVTLTGARFSDQRVLEVARRLSDAIRCPNSGYAPIAT